MKSAKLLRRGTALFLATTAAWWLIGSSGAGAAAERILAAGATAAPPENAYGLGFWDSLVVSQSPYLQGGLVLTGPALSEPLPEDGVLPAQDGPAESEPVMEEETPIPSSAPEATNVIAQTLLPATDGSYPSAGGVFLYNRTHQAVDMEALAQSPVELTGQGNGPRILIVHTHATEAYTQEGQDVYTESDPYRTTDDAHNVVRVGDEMAAAFAQAGLNVLHDRTLYDYPNYNGAYTRSREAVTAYLEAYPSISVVLDVHRDALGSANGTVYKAVTDASVLPDCAQVMLVVGTQEAGGSHPNWRQNLSFAMTLERELNRQYPTLARPIALRTSHYNQHLSPGSLLVEVGTHGNSLQEAINGARAFAQTAAPVIKSLLPE